MTPMSGKMNNALVHNDGLIQFGGVKEDQCFAYFPSSWIHGKIEEKPPVLCACMKSRPLLACHLELNYCFVEAQNFLPAVFIHDHGHIGDAISPVSGDDGSIPATARIPLEDEGVSNGNSFGADKAAQRQRRWTERVVVALDGNRLRIWHGT